MDGYAVALAPGSRSLVFRLVRGGMRRGLRPGDATAIVTGAKLPRGANSVVRREIGLVNHGALVIRTPLRRGADVHEPGESIPRGFRLIRRGAPIDGYAISALLASGITRIPVQHLRVSVHATGSELRAPGEPGRRPLDAIGPALTALLNRWADARYAGVLADDPGAIAQRLRDAARRNQLLVTIGGSSVGPRDFTKHAVGRVGRMVVGGTRVNVLKRAGVGLVAGTPVLVLPGQIESAMVAFHEYGLALLERMLGSPLKEFAELPLARRVRVRHPMDSTYLFEERHGRAEPLDWGISRYDALVRATGFAYLAHGRSYPTGATIRLQRFVR